MMNESIIHTAETYLQTLCLDIPGRQVGSRGNQVATNFFADIAASFGFQVRFSWFECLDWRSAGIHIAVQENSFEGYASPYTLGCQAQAPLTVISTLLELENSDITDKIVLLHGEIAREQLMPKNFPFYNPEEHQRIIRLLETKKPRAILAATSRDAVMAGGLYPFPLIEDGDFDIPNGYMTEEEGERLAHYTGQQMTLEIRAERNPSLGCNVMARKGNRQDRRIVLCAHIDAKMGSPGALDNACGVVVVLLLAQLLKDYHGDLGIELIAMNGEDYYSNPGEQRFLSDNINHFNEIVLGINLDGVGYREGATAFSLYDCPEDLANSIREVFSHHAGLIEGEAWYQGDHGLFVMNGRPALAMTSENAMELMTHFVHTHRDKPELADVKKLVNIALALKELVLHLDQQRIQH